MVKRKLENLNLLDDFLFGTLVSHPDLGEAFVREILNTIFNRKFGKLNIVPQKVYYGTDTDKHGARLDVYLEDADADGAENATVYDIEPDQNSDSEALLALPRRTRFYHAKIDAVSLKSGENYGKLKNVIVILITPYDPFGQNRMVYTVRSKCEELPDLPYDDGARTLFLYTRGTEGNPRRELIQLLRYMEDTTEENAGNDSLRTIHNMVNTVKQDGEVTLEFMKIFEREEMLIRQGRKEEQVNTERERQRAERAEVLASSEKARADSAEALASNEKARADSAEAEVQRLQEKLRKLQEEMK